MPPKSPLRLTPEDWARIESALDYTSAFLNLVSNWENDRVRPSRELTERLLEAAAAQDTELTAALRDHLDALAYHESQQEVAAAERRRHLGLREDVFSLPEGQVLVRWPADVPPEEIPALADWLELIKHKITRTP